MDEHEIEAMGKTKIIIRNGKISEVGEPDIKYCPLFHKHRGIEKLDKKSIKANIRFRIDDFGLCSPNREIKMKDFLSFGISETLSTLLNENVIDCSIMVCEGCGTVIVTDGEKAQGIGGRVSGLIKTTPIQEIIRKVGVKNVLNPRTALVDQIKGIETAMIRGYKNIAVTIVSPEDCKVIKDLEKENKKNGKNISIYIFAVHTTGVNEKEAKRFFECCDVITACASKHIRDIGEKIATKKVGEYIPIYAATEKGKEFLELRLERIGGMKPKKHFKSPEPLI